MKIEENLIHFFKTGSLENIPYGITREALIQILGESDWEHFSARKHKHPTIYKYGRLEFYFEDEKSDAWLSGVIFQALTAPTDNGFLNLNDHGWTGKTGIKEVITFLKTNNINFEEQDDKWDKELKLLVTEGNVTIFLDCQQTAGQYRLHKASRFIAY